VGARASVWSAGINQPRSHYLGGVQSGPSCDGALHVVRVVTRRTYTLAWLVEPAMREQPSEEKHGVTPPMCGYVRSSNDGPQGLELG
jgi:hypothetical protein